MSGMRRSCCFSLILFGFFSQSFSQDVVLFQKQAPLQLRAKGSVKSIKKNSNDSTLIAGKFEYEQNQQWIPVPVKTRVRGNFRLKNCYFPPLKLKFSKKDVASTVFAGNKSLKLVLPCRTSSDYNDLILKEYLCYQFYQVLTPYYFRTRLANLELTEISRKKPKTYSLLTFFVEDNDMVARRSGGKVMEVKGLHPTAFDEKQSIRNDYFQYMIGNSDWSAVYQHNSNTLHVGSTYVPLSYDFDMSGFVNASYAKVNPQVGTGDVRDRVYRGFCKSDQAMQEVRHEFIKQEGTLMTIIKQHATQIDAAHVNDMTEYLNGFFEILKNDDSFKKNILTQCRTDK